MDSENIKKNKISVLYKDNTDNVRNAEFTLDKVAGTTEGANRLILSGAITKGQSYYVAAIPQTTGKLKTCFSQTPGMKSLTVSAKTASSSDRC